MNAKLMTALTFVASRSRRFRKFMPLLSILPVALGAYRWFMHRKAKKAQKEIAPPSYAERPGAYSLRSSEPAPSFR